MNKIIRIFCLLIIALMAVDVEAQNTNKWKGKDIDFDLYPEVAGLCPEQVLPNGEKPYVLVQSIESFQSYEWTRIETSDIIGTDQEVKIEYPGAYKLEVETTMNNVDCTLTKLFTVYDMSDNDQIRQYLDESGFYAIRIKRSALPPPGIDGEGAAGSRNDCTTAQINFDQSDTDYTAFMDMAEAVLYNFKILQSIDGSKNAIGTENDCFCQIGADIISGEFDQSDVAIWGHEFFATDEDYNGYLYVKARKPFEESLPLVGQKIILQSVHESILEENAGTFQQGKTILSDLFMGRPIGGFYPGVVCDPGDTEDDSYYLSPAGMPVQVPSGSTELIFQEEASDYYFGGSLLALTLDDKVYLSHEYSGGLFAGYYNYINSNFIEDFEVPVSNGEYELINLPFRCEGLCYNREASIIFDDQEALPSDGGFDYYTKSSIDNNKIFLSKKTVRGWILDLISAVRLGDNTFLTASDYNNKYLFATNVTLGGQVYEAIGTKVNDPHDADEIYLDLVSPSILDDPGEGKFEYSIDLANGDLLISAFNTVKDCNKFPKHYYRLDEVGYEDAIIENQALVDQLFDYLTNVAMHENLLIFANGYRFNGNLIFSKANVFKSWSEFLNTEYEKKDNIRFFDHYSDSGEYWDDIDDLFISHIGTDNVIYADGHDNILTANHNNTYALNFDNSADVKKSKLSLAVSYASTLLIRGWRKRYKALKSFVKLLDSEVATAIPPYDSACIDDPDCLRLNYNSNVSGFNVRYNNGYSYGFEVADAILAGKKKLQKIIWIRSRERSI